MYFTQATLIVLFSMFQYHSTNSGMNTPIVPFGKSAFCLHNSCGLTQNLCHAVSLGLPVLTNEKPGNCWLWPMRSRCQTKPCQSWQSCILFLYGLTVTLPKPYHCVMKVIPTGVSRMLKVFPRQEFDCSLRDLHQANLAYSLRFILGKYQTPP